MGEVEQSPLLIIILLLLNLKLQQTISLIPKMLQIFILHIIIIVLDFLFIENLLLQLLLISLVHNFEYSFVDKIADITNTVSKSFVSKNVRDIEFSFHNSVSAIIKAHIADVPNKIFIPIIAVIV